MRFFPQFSFSYKIWTTHLTIHFHIYKFIFVRTRFVTTRNSVGFARRKVQTISFIERGFERLDFGHKIVGFWWCSYITKSCSPQEFFSQRRVVILWFSAIFPSQPLGALSFTLYSHSWLILALHLLIRQVPASVPVPSARTLLLTVTD